MSTVELLILSTVLVVSIGCISTVVLLRKTISENS